MLSATFKIQHWPYANKLFYLFCIILIFLMVPSYFIKAKTKTEVQKDNSHNVLLISIAFTIFLVYNGGMMSKGFLYALSMNASQIEKNVNKLNTKTEYLYQSFELLNDKNNNANYAKAQQLKVLSNNLLSYISNTQSYLKSRVDRIPIKQADTTDIEYIVDQLNFDIPSKIMMSDTGNFTGFILKNKIDIYREAAIDFVTDEQKEIIKSGVNLSTDKIEKSEDGQEESWESYYFNHVPLNTVVTTLASIKYEVKNTEAQVLTNLLNHASTNDKTNLAAQIAELGVKYETQKQEQKLALLEKDKQLFDAKLDEKQKDIDEKKNTIVIFILCIVAFSIMLFYIIRNNILRRKINLELIKQKDIIENQKSEVEKKNTEILDSIEYAKRIQNTILPPQKIVSQYLEKSFILYLPKDIVAGDFYWMSAPPSLPKGEEKNIPNSNEEILTLRSTEKFPLGGSPKLEENEIEGPYILFAACDCTGHGVPGAMVSVVCSNALNKAVNEFGLNEPAKILDKVAELVIEDLSKNNEDNDEIKDGMDASLAMLTYNETRNAATLQWAGANNPLWIIRNGELLETKADKQPIGKTDNLQPFTNHEIQLQKGDSIYLFTDGYADQFGGEKGKRFMRHRFKDLLISIQNLPMNEQRETLYNAHIEWKGSVEQVDDICVIGVRV
jgi:serine phosphatase RsbU (regulator of sigma subunit)